VSNLTIDLVNRAARAGRGAAPLLHAVEQPSLEVAQALLRYKGIRLNVVTGGPAVVREALAAGRRRSPPAPATRRRWWTRPRISRRPGATW